MPTTATAKPAWMPESFSWFSCAANTVMPRLCRSRKRSVPAFRATTFCRLEAANLLRASGKNDEAEEQYRRVWQNGREGKYGSLHYEIAAIGLGDLLRSEKKYQAAAAAYELVSEVAVPDPELSQKANLGAGEMYDQLQKRDLAVKKYEAVVATNSANAEADKARKRIKDAYRE